MCKTKFIPKEFHDVVCDLNSGGDNPCTPEEVLFAIRINAPKEVIFYVKGGYSPNLPRECLQLPLCMVAIPSNIRADKYYDLFARVISVRKVGSDEWQVDKIVGETPIAFKMPVDTSAYDTICAEEQLERHNKALRYSDDEIDILPASIYTNNADLYKHTKLLFEEGDYEVFISRYGLESNHITIKISFKDISEYRE